MEGLFSNVNKAFNDTYLLTFKDKESAARAMEMGPNLFANCKCMKMVGIMNIVEDLDKLKAVFSENAEFA